MDNNYNYNAGPYMQPNPSMHPQTPKKKGCGFGIAALVIGILSMTLCCVGGSLFGLVGIILGIVALCRMESKYGLAIGGIVTSVFGILIGIYMLFVVILTVVAYDEIKDMDERELEYWLEERMEDIQNGHFGDFDAGGSSVEQNPFVYHAYDLDDGSTIHFFEDGSFLWFEDDSDHNDNYYSGTYKSYMAEEAEDYLTNGLEAYSVTQEELDDFHDRNADSAYYTEDNLCCLVLQRETLFMNGEVQDYEPQTRNYMGYYYNGTYDAANMDSASYVLFTMVE